MNRKDEVARGGPGRDPSGNPVPRIDASTAGLLEVDVSTEGDATVLSLAGEFDLATLELAERGLRSARDGSKSGRVVIDLRGLTFICSTGILFLVKARDELGQNLTVRESDSPAVRRLLGIVGLEGVLGSAAAAG